jgi:hypothetical protein
MRYAFPFRYDNRKPDGTWDAPDATDDNIKGTSVDPYDPVWPRWRRTPPPGANGEFISDQPFFDIDEITQRVELHPPGRPLADWNVDGQPASRRRVGDVPSGNHWRRRLLVAPAAQTPRNLDAFGTLHAQAGEDTDLAVTGLDPFTGKIVTEYKPAFYDLDPTSRASVLMHEQKHRDMIKPYADRGLMGWAEYWYDRNWSRARGTDYFELPAYRAQAEFLADYGLPTATPRDLRFLFTTVEPKIEEILAKRPDLR